VIGGPWLGCSAQAAGSRAAAPFHLGVGTQVRRLYGLRVGTPMRGLYGLRAGAPAAKVGEPARRACREGPWLD